MQVGLAEYLQAWGLALLVYPGVLFAVLLALAVEWAHPFLQPLLTRGPRTRARLRPPLFPLTNFLKLTGRRPNAGWPGASTSPLIAGGTGAAVLEAATAVAPLLALVMMPFPANPLRSVGISGDLLLVGPLMVVQPLTGALLGLRAGGQAALAGAQDLGRVLTGLLPALLAVAALVEVSSARSIEIAPLMAAPETGAQTLVRLLAGAVLLVALPWWIGTSDSGEVGGGPGAYAGGLIQAVALGAFWSMLILPGLGNQALGVLLFILATLLVSVAMRLIMERALPVRRERDRAGLVWATALPVSVVALLVSIWWGGL